MVRLTYCTGQAPRPEIREAIVGDGFPGLKTEKPSQGTGSPSRMGTKSETY